MNDWKEEIIASNIIDRLSALEEKQGLKEHLDLTKEIGKQDKKIEALESVVKNLRVGNILEKKVLERIDALEERLKEFQIEKRIEALEEKMEVLEKINVNNLEELIEFLKQLEGKQK